jgi:hypothetical protein
MPVIALGAVFSALEIVPLTILGFEAAGNMRIVAKSGAKHPYRWPIYFFVSVAFWNLVGAGVFGFLINPPIVLYYAQGINTTPIHSHTALFGVYGLLAIALMLFSVRHIVARASWSDSLLKWSFWVGLLSVLSRGEIRPVARAKSRDRVGRGHSFLLVDARGARSHLHRGCGAPYDLPGARGLDFVFSEKGLGEARGE